MYTKSWHVIKDDKKKTFEVCGQSSNDNGFVNRVIAMQRAGLNVSWVTPPVTNKTSSRDLITFIGYTKEAGLFDRLSRETSDLNRPSFDSEDDENL
jgi:hypothetical protein